MGDWEAGTAFEEDVLDEPETLDGLVGLAGLVGLGAVVRLGDGVGGVDVSVGSSKRQSLTSANSTVRRLFLAVR